MVLPTSSSGGSSMIHAQSRVALVVVPAAAALSYAAVKAAGSTITLLLLCYHGLAGGQNEVIFANIICRQSIKDLRRPLCSSVFIFHGFVGRILFNPERVQNKYVDGEGFITQRRVRRPSKAAQHKVGPFYVVLRWLGEDEEEGWIQPQKRMFACLSFSDFGGE